MMRAVRDLACPYGLFRFACWLFFSVRLVTWPTPMTMATAAWGAPEARIAPPALMAGIAGIEPAGMPLGCSLIMQPNGNFNIGNTAFWWRTICFILHCTVSCWLFPAKLFIPYNLNKYPVINTTVVTSRTEISIETSSFRLNWNVCMSSHSGACTYNIWWLLTTQMIHWCNLASI